MAPTQHNISVLVVDGTYHAFSQLGFPIPALAAIQEAGLQIRGACWDVKRSHFGLSVSFFWPSSKSDSVLAQQKCTIVASSNNKCSKAKKRRIRRTMKKAKASEVTTEQNLSSKPPIKAHHSVLSRLMTFSSNLKVLVYLFVMKTL